MKTLNKIFENALLVDVNGIANLFRITHLHKEADVQPNQILYRASLYSSGVSLNVTWITSATDDRIDVGTLVRVNWMTKKILPYGVNIINGVSIVSSLNYQETLESTIPRSWFIDGFALGAFFEYLNDLSWEYKTIINQVLLNKQVLFHFLKSPFSLSGEYSKLGGNLQKVVEEISFLRTSRVSHHLEPALELLISATILVGIGRFDQYLYDPENHVYRFFTNHTRDPRMVGGYLVAKSANEVGIRSNPNVLALENLVRNFKFV